MKEKMGKEMGNEMKEKKEKYNRDVDAITHLASVFSFLEEKKENTEIFIDFFSSLNL
jgi:hypothetical protein